MTVCLAPRKYLRVHIVAERLGMGTAKGTTAATWRSRRALRSRRTKRLSFQLARSAPNFQGTWAGPWVRQSCSEAGSLVGFCALFNGGAIVLRLTQSGTTAQGTLSGLGPPQMTVSGAIGATGTLTLTGQGTSPFGDTLALNDWQSQVLGNTMTGSFSFVILSPPNTVAGTATVTATFEHVPRVG
jgi:hypothetical protein